VTLLALFGISGFAFVLVVLLARGRPAEGVATRIDRPWSDFCEAHGLMIRPASGLLGEAWPMISGVVGGVPVDVDVRDDRYAGRTPSTRVSATALVATRGVLRVEARDGRSPTTGRTVQTGDATFDGELRVYADGDAVARLLDGAVRRALLEVASRHELVLEIDTGKITLTVPGVLSQIDELDAAVRAAVACARARDSVGYR
jgi:hypothetical protein